MKLHILFLTPLIMLCVSIQTASAACTGSSSCSSGNSCTGNVTIQPPPNQLANVHVHRPPAVTLNKTPEEFHISTGLR